MGWVCVIESCFKLILGSSDWRGRFSSTCRGWGMEISISVVSSGHGHVYWKDARALLLIL